MMKWSEWLERWGMTSQELSAGFLKAKFEPQDPDRNAAWALYVELITRITSKYLNHYACRHGRRGGAACTVNL
jgi:hypothetical protein